MPDISKEINTFFKQCDWGNARIFILRLLKKEPNNHWLLTRLSTTYYEEYNYKKAMVISEKAIKLAPRCPLVLWDYAGSLDMLSKHQKAIIVWKKLLNLGIERIANDECGEGIRWARSLVNDTTYRIGIAYSKMGKTSIAINCIEEHIKKRMSGIPSIYPLRKVRKDLSLLRDDKRENLRDDRK